VNPLTYIPFREFEKLRALDSAPVLRTRLFATLCRVNALYMIARAGSGHIGSSFSAMDIVSWLWLNELEFNDGGIGANDVYFSSKGHDAPGLYAVLIGLGILPFEKIHALRRLGGLPGHPDIASTPVVATNTGSLGMGISKAKGMALANRLQQRRGRVFVLTGDGELQEGQLWESLASAANQRLGEIVAIVDHNKLQSDTFVKNVSDLGDLEAKFRAFGWHVERCDGHDLDAFAAVLARVKKIADKPKVIIADTIKGRGVSFMEHTSLDSDTAMYRFHSGAPDVETYERAVAELIASAREQASALGVDLKTDTSPRPVRAVPERAQKLVAAYSQALVEQAGRNPRIVALDADLVLDTGLIPFQKKFPERFVECGIAEQDMVSQAGGMALRGLLPVVHSFACFLSPRPNEQIYNNASERTKIIYVGSLAGLLPGGPGHSHQCVRDIAALAAIPGLVLIEPATEREVALALDWCVNGTRESCYLRLVSIPCEIPFELPADHRLELGKGVAITAGDGAADAVLFGYGPVLLPQAWHAAKTLREQHGFGLRVVNLPWLNRIDDAWLRETLAGVSHVFTLDNHYITGGQGEMIAARIAELGLGARVTRFGLTDIPACGQNDEVLRAHGLDAGSLVERILAQR
jgi:transketolase